jgi:AmmeMemoRadiSam system protein A
MKTSNPPLTTTEREFLLNLARESITAQATGQHEPAINEASLPASLSVPRGCFVTLTQQGDLRGCIGNIHPREPLFRAVMENARGAAFRDSRFAPVDEGEVPGLEIEISVLSTPVPLEFTSPESLLGKLRPGVDGVVLKIEGRTATFLPQVWRKFPEPERFLDLLAEKARLSADSWRAPEAVVLTYQVESFGTSGIE